MQQCNLIYSKINQVSRFVLYDIDNLFLIRVSVWKPILLTLYMYSGKSCPKQSPIIFFLCTFWGIEHWLNIMKWPNSVRNEPIQQSMKGDISLWQSLFYNQWRVWWQFDQLEKPLLQINNEYKINSAKLYYPS